LDPYSATTAEKLLTTTSYRRDEIEEIVNIRKNGIKPTTSHATFYWSSEHFSFQRPDFFTSVRLYSTRNYNMEQPYNSEGLLNHHRGDGANHISRTGDEYYGIAPVFDYQKVPGTTTLQKPTLPSEKLIHKLGLTDFVGAATDGKYAAVSFDFRSPHDPLVARKSWFFFDQEYVCLGAGISTRTDLPVVTTLNQCLLRDQVTVSMNNRQQVISKGEKSYQNVDWVFQDGIGYIFPESSTVNIQNSEATGSWYNINKQTDTPKDEVKLDVFKLWLDHGAAPSEASYQYMVAPATSLEKLAQGISKQNIVILANTPEMQVVQHRGLNMVQMVFYTGAELKLNDGTMIKADQPGIILLKFSNGKVSEVTASDPNRELRNMNFSLSGRYQCEGEVVWDEATGVSHFSVPLPQGVFAGKSTTIKCQ